MKRLKRMLARGFRPGREKGSIMILVLLISAIMSLVMTFSLRASMNDTHMVYRQLEYVQARGTAEGALNVAKGDVLCQIAATNFLGGAFQNAEDKYNSISTRFNNASKRIPSDMAITPGMWEDPAVISRAMWDFASDSNLKLLPAGTPDWLVGSAMPSGAPRVYVTRSSVGGSSLATGAVASYDITITAVSTAGADSILPVPAVLSLSFHHQLSYPRLFDYLMLGSNLSDCSMCHLKMWGDIGQVDASNPVQLHIPYNANRFNRLTLNGSLHTNGNFLRTTTSTESTVDGVQHKSERMLATPGQNGQYIYAKNGGALASQYLAENPGTPAANNPYRQIDTLATPLPTQWPSVKENLLNWFEPRSVAQTSSGESELRATYLLDNNFVRSSWIKADGTTVGSAIGSGSSPYNRAIDRVVTQSMLSSGNLVYDTGLHPCDDVDGDSIPNAFDADADGDGIPETPRASENPSDPAWHLTSTAVASNWTFHAPTNKFQWTKGRTYNSSTGKWSRASTYQNDNKALINDSTRSWLYSQTGSGTSANYQWTAEVTGVAATMADLIDNNQANNSGTPGVVKGVWPNAALDSSGNPDYTQNGGKRHLIVSGSAKNPIKARGQVVVRGDLVIQGTVNAEQAVIVTHRNIYIPHNLIYKVRPDYDNPSNTAGNQLGLVSSGNILVGNIMHNMVDAPGTGTGQTGNASYTPSSTARTDILAFVWGNMVNCNDPMLASWDWGVDGSTDGGAKNHMINTVYLMDGADGGRWVNGQWKTENSGNLVSNVFNTQGMKVGGGLNTSSPYFNSARKHLNFTGNSNPNTTADNTSVFKNFYISTPGLLPSGASSINSLPKTDFGTFTGSWFTSDDLKFFTLKPQDASGNRINGLGATLNSSGTNQTLNYKWLNHVESVLYADYGVVGGNLPTTNGGGNYMEFYGTVIGRDVQLISAKQNNPNTNTKYTKNIGALYYDGRLKGSINPLNFPFEEDFLGGEMAMNGVPAPNGNRDNWTPYRLTSAYLTGPLFQY